MDGPGDSTDRLALESLWLLQTIRRMNGYLRYALAVAMTGAVVLGTWGASEWSDSDVTPQVAADELPGMPPRPPTPTGPVPRTLASLPLLDAPTEPVAGVEDGLRQDPPISPPPVATGGAAGKGAAPITFYACVGPNGGFCDEMRSGEIVYEGAAACGSAYALGELVRIAGDPTGRTYVCEDTGLLAPWQLDVFWYNESDGWTWLAEVGPVAAVERVR